MTEHDDGGASRPRRRVAERLLGAAAEPSAARPERVHPAAPRAVRWAVLVVALEAGALLAGVGALLYLVATDSVGSAGNALGLAAFTGLFAIALAGCAVGLWRLSLWARSPVLVMQILLLVIGYTAGFQAHQPAFGIPVIVLAAVELYLLATPEARLAFYRRTDA